MDTRVSSASKEVVISYDRSTVLIGERINPSGKKKLAASLQAGTLDVAIQEALAQVHAGAEMLDVNVAALGVDEVVLLPEAVKAVMETVNVPLCIDSTNPAALEAALKAYKGKALVNSVQGEEKSLQTVLPIIKHYGAAVVGLTMDDKGIPGDADRRAAIAHRIIERAEKIGIPREDVVIDCLARTLAAESMSGPAVLEAIRRVRTELGVNQTLGAGNVSFYMPERHLLTGTFLAMAIAAGVTCPIVDVAAIRSYVLAADLVMGRDNHALRYIRAFRERQKAKG
ncbi:MAG: pterin-binding protein [Chloroflexi bacterium RBG_16_57_8]|nr:MAG: pterin-binding protein [Chloroflexi bacterium RBG_16_57_8]